MVAPSITRICLALCDPEGGGTARSLNLGGCLCKAKGRLPEDLHLSCTDMRRLTTGIRSKKCVVRRFRCCANVYLHKPR
jgi:hypothetical protein